MGMKDHQKLRYPARPLARSLVFSFRMREVSLRRRFEQTFCQRKSRTANEKIRRPIFPEYSQPAMCRSRLSISGRVLDWGMEGPFTSSRLFQQNRETTENGRLIPSNSQTRYACAWLLLSFFPFSVLSKRLKKMC